MNDKDNIEQTAASSAATAKKLAVAKHSIKTFLMYVAGFAVFTYVGLFVVFGVYIQRGVDMYPSINDGDMVFMYRLDNQYHVGQCVRVRTDDGYYLTSRVVAVGGDSVRISTDGHLFVNGVKVVEGVFYATFPSTDHVEGEKELQYVVPASEYFVLGDFRENATDSRVFSSVEHVEIEGSVVSLLRQRNI